MSTWLGYTILANTFCSILRMIIILTFELTGWVKLIVLFGLGGPHLVNWRHGQGTPPACLLN